MPRHGKTASCCVLAAKVFGSIADNVQSLHTIQSQAGQLVSKLISSVKLSELNLENWSRDMADSSHMSYIAAAGILKLEVSVISD